MAIDFADLSTESFDLPPMSSYSAGGEYELPIEGEALVKCVELSDWEPSSYGDWKSRKAVWEILDPEENRGQRIKTFINGNTRMKDVEVGDEYVGQVFHKPPTSDGKVYASIAFIPPEGVYTVRLVNVGPPERNDENPKQLKRTLVFEIQDEGDWQGFELRQRYTWSNHEQANLNKVITALVGGKQDPDKSYGPGDLIGKTMLVTVSHGLGKSMLYANIGKDPVAVKKSIRGKAPF